MWSKGSEEKGNGNVASHFLKYVDGMRVSSSGRNKEGLNYVTYEYYVVEVGGNFTVQRNCYKTINSLSLRILCRSKRSTACDFIRRRSEHVWIGDRQLHLKQV
jgi:hypothetical protein